MKVNILGTEYTVECKDKSEDKFLLDRDGYCDKTTHSIVVINEDDESELGDFNAYQKTCIRHELIHAFMFESGLSNDWEKPHQFGHDETTVDWIAIQFPKMMKAFKDANCL